jgi:nucleoside-diphosphate-sugar epimerase
MSDCVLVTGASGFVGRAVVRRAAADGRRVRAATRQLLATDWPSKVDVMPAGDLEREPAWHGGALDSVDAIVHCAARVHVMKESAIDPLAAFRAVNAVGTLQLARQAAASGVRRFIFISTLHVNGNETFDRPFNPEDNAAPHSAYAVSKHEAELGLRSLASQTGLEVVIVRPPLVYGPGVSGNFGRLMCALYQGLPLPFRAVHNRRSLVALDNLVDLIVTCLDHPKAPNQTFLVSDGEDLSTPELLRRTAEALGRTARLFAVPPPVLRVAARLLGKAGVAQQLCGSLQVDMRKTRELLGWAPPTAVNTALAQTARHFLAELRRP